MSVENVASMMRLPDGTRLRLVRSLMGSTPEDKQLRTIKGRQSNALLMEPAHKPGSTSWLPKPKASDFRATPDGFAVLARGEVAAEYVIVA